MPNIVTGQAGSPSSMMLQVSNPLHAGGLVSIFVCVRPISTDSIQQQAEWQHIQHERQPSKQQQSRTRTGYCGSRDV